MRGSFLSGRAINFVMTDLLFDTPWWLPTILAVIGIVLFVSGNRRSKGGVRNTGVGFVAAAIALMLVSYFVMTQKEKCVAQARAIVHDAGRQDFTAMKGLLESGTVVNGLLTGPGQIVPVAQEAATAYKLSSLTILSTDAQRKQTVITVALTVLAQSDANQPTRVDCQFQWNQSADGWHLQNIDVTNIGGRNPDELMKRMRSFR